MTAAAASPRSLLADTSNRVAANLEFGDGLMFFFILVFVRQYFWIVSNNTAAWTLTLPLALSAWVIYVATKPFPAEKFGWRFWVVVAIPLSVAYSIRVAWPDHSFDVLTYHLLHSERSLRGPLFAPGDFFPTATPFNPAPDTLTGISRMIFGFRLGTLINLLVLIWTAQVTDKILREFIGGVWVRAIAVLMIVLAENLLFEVSTYMVDLLALPLMLEATFLTLRAGETETRRSVYLHIALLLGFSTAFKISNLAVVLPLFAICAYQLRSEIARPVQLLKTTSMALIMFLAAMLPFTIFIFRLTGNPVFPIANGFFNSPSWPIHGGWDNRWGPQVWWETILWPILIWFHPERHSELSVYSGRLSLAFVVALAGLVIAWRSKQGRRVWLICFILITSSLLWSAAGLGYSRYGLYQEVFAGIAMMVIASALWRSSKSKPWFGQIGAAAIAAALVAQTALGFSYFLDRDWSSRSTLVKDPGRYAHELSFMLRDRDLPAFLDEQQRASLGRVGVWLETCSQSTGFEVLINPYAPIIAVRQPEYFATRESWRMFIRTVEQTAGRQMFSLCLNGDVPKAKEALAERGLEVGELIPIDLHFFSAADRVALTLIEIQSPKDPEALNRFQTAWMKSAFPTSVYREEIIALNPPATLRAGEKTQIQLKVRNLGDAAWPAVGSKDFRYQVNVGNRWFTGATKLEDNRAVLSGDLPPGGESQITLTVNAPPTPGDYTLEIDMVHEGVTWFSEKGGRPLRLPVRVSP